MHLIKISEKRGYYLKIEQEGAYESLDRRIGWEKLSN